MISIQPYQYSHFMQRRHQSYRSPAQINFTNYAFFSNYISLVTLLCCKKQDYDVTESLLYSFNEIYAPYLQKADIAYKIFHSSLKQ